MKSIFVSAIIKAVILAIMVGSPFVISDSGEIVGYAIAIISFFVIGYFEGKNSINPYYSSIAAFVFSFLNPLMYEKTGGDIHTSLVVLIPVTLVALLIPEGVGLLIGKGRVSNAS